MDLLVKKSILKHAIWLSSIILPIQTPDQSFSVLNWMYNVRKKEHISPKNWYAPFVALYWKVAQFLRIFQPLQLLLQKQQLQQLHQP